MTEEKPEPKFSVGDKVMLSPEGIRFFHSASTRIRFFHSASTPDDRYILPNRIYTISKVRPNRYSVTAYSYLVKENPFYYWPENHLTNMIEPDD